MESSVETGWSSLKPAKVASALKLLYLVVGIGVVRTAITVIRHADVRSPYFLMGVKLTVYAMCLVIIYQVGKGRNWARWLLVAILFICLPLIVFPAFGAFAHNPIMSTLEFLQLGLSLVALGLSFHDSSQWFFHAPKTTRRGCQT